MLLNLGFIAVAVVESCDEPFGALGAYFVNGEYVEGPGDRELDDQKGRKRSIGSERDASC